MLLEIPKETPTGIKRRIPNSDPNHRDPSVPGVFVLFAALLIFGVPFFFSPPCPVLAAEPAAAYVLLLFKFKSYEGVLHCCTVACEETVCTCRGVV